MGCCTGRCLLITLCVLQMIATVERQVFDFLGYMWAPIIGNFLQIIFIIVGFFGALQYRPKIVIVYAVWSLLWIGWNIFVICFYFEVGLLKRDSPILNIDTGNRSWWFDNGIGCQTPNKTQLDTGLDYVEGCLLQYYYVEIIHAAIQCLFSLLGFCVGCYVVYVFSEEDDSSFWESQPVHDELEYIKMRYRSPARSSFRDQKAYETLNTRSTYTNSTERNPDFSDNSTEHLAPGKNPHGVRRLRQSHVNTTPTDSPRFTETSIQPPRFTDIGSDYIDRYSNPYPSPPPPGQTTIHSDLGDPCYNVQNIGGSTVI